MHEPLGTHTILDLYDCSAELLSQPATVERLLRTAAERMGATVVTTSFHHFSPLGVSGVVVIMESHLAIHTWPEHAYAAVDLFTCGTLAQAAGVEYLTAAFGAQRHRLRTLHRGLLPTAPPAVPPSGSER